MKRFNTSSSIFYLALVGFGTNACGRADADSSSGVESSLNEVKVQNTRLLEQVTKLSDQLAKVDEKVTKINVRPSAPSIPGAPDPALKYKVPLDSAQVRGNPEALVTVVEWSDYQCPFCSRAEAIVAEVQKHYGDQVRVAFKHNPLSSHKQALGAAIAAEAAGRQGKFWQMHAKLFEHQRELSDENYRKWAQELELDLAKFTTDLADPTIKSAIETQQKQGSLVGARSTPAFFINGRFLSGAQPVDKFKEIIDAELKVAQAYVDKGVAKRDVYAKVMESAKEKP